MARLRAMVLKTWIAAYGGFIPEIDMRTYFAEAYSEDNLRRIAAAADNWITVAANGTEMVGFMRTFIASDKRFHVASLYVEPKHQRGGIGFRLMQAAEDQARDSGHREIWLGVMKQNHMALAWYQRLGFVFEREEPFTMGRTSVPHLIGHRTLPQ